YMDFSISHAYVHGAVYYLPDHAPIARTADFAKMTIGTLKGSVAYNDAVANNSWGGTLRGYASFAAALEATRKGECDVALFLLPPSGAAQDVRGLKATFVDDLIYRFHFAVHKGDTATLARLNESLAAVRQSGEFDRLWEKWIGPTEPHSIRLTDLRPFFIPFAAGLVIVLAIFVWQRRMLGRVERHAQALRESEERFRTTFEHAGIGMALVDPTGHLIRSNPVFQRMIGYTEDEIKGMTFREFTHPDDQAPDLKLYQELVDGKRSSYQLEKRYIRKDGQLIWGHLTVSVLETTNDGSRFAVGMVEDVTEKKQIEDALHQTQQRLQAILDYSPTLIFVSNLEGRYLLTNRLFNEKYGRSGESMVGRRTRDLVAPAEADLREAHNRQVIEGGVPQSFEEHNEEGGTTRTYLAVKFPLRDEQGKVYGLGGIATDITEYKALQMQFTQAQKMEAFGQLAGGIAHDFNNILAVLLMQLNMFSARTDLPAGVVDKVKNLEDITQKASRLTRQLLVFSRSEAVSMQDVDLNQVIANVLKILDRVLGEHIELAFDRRRPPLWIHADVGMMEQIIMNLCVNSRDAMAGGGRLVIDTKVVEFNTTVGDARRPGRFACLSVSDSGHGMDAATLKRIFEPFFTTKDVGKGTGLGLATVYGITKQHDGWIEVDSTVGQGTTFLVYLPVREQPKTYEVENTQGAIKGGTERVLIVEDDAAVREVCVFCLQLAGYDVIEAADAVEGLKVWEDQAYRFDLLLTDMVMPGGMSGLQLARHLKQAKPALRVIFFSGYSAQAANTRTPFSELGTYLAKPVDREKLLRAVRSALDAN
ncbi:MAG: PAS domain S-box protein, partial [Opitutaceae bacterium]